MKGALLPLSQISPGKEVTLIAIHGSRGLKARLTDMGLFEGMKLKVIHSHRPGPCIILVGGTRLILGYGMAQKILVKEE
jgi:ferrous iron transport protein A